MLSLLAEKILVLDGALGTMIQRRGLKGNNDALTLTRPDVIEDIARAYVEAGADIISTDTFNANAISQADYGMEAYVREMNREGARITRRVADKAGRKVFVAGSIGPTNKTASMSADVADPGARQVTYDELYHAYAEQIEGLMEGGVDVLLFETVFDTLNLKAGLDAAVEVMDRVGQRLPIMLSVTIAGKDGRTFSGQTLEAFLASVSHAPIASVGLNCSFGPRDIMPWLRELARVAPYPVSCHPNAGLPDASGQYSETPDSMAEVMREMVDEGLVNIIGGCCGTTPEHIAKLPEIVAGKRPRIVPEKTAEMRLSGLEMLEVKPENRFVSVGERCNVAGSRKFLRLVKEHAWDEAIAIARGQVEAGARIIDINMDDGLVDTPVEMCRFLNLIATEPDIAAVPVMIDSSRWDVIEAALKCVQGKPIVNSISLKEGEEELLRRARRLRRLGAAVVVMAFDEKGQADTFERKIEVCERAYRLLTGKAGFPPEDIIFDPNVLAIATGIPEHDRYALDFIRATGWIKRNLPGAKVSGGVSNLSFSFRGNNALREAMHTVFLYHAIREGMDMAIVNPSATLSYDEIEPELRTLIEDVVLARDPSAPERLAEKARGMVAVKEKGGGEASPSEAPAWRLEPVAERLGYALMHGIESFLARDIEEILASGVDPVAVIDGPLMQGMNRVGQLFGEGKMFLPQVVKTARTMKAAVAILQPEIDRRNASGGGKKAGKILFATVKGDVHDIGKNIVSIVLNCNGYEVLDLGVMVPAETIVDVALRERPDIVCLSGLITPSLEEMGHTLDEMTRAGLDIPVMVGGATTSRLHTALKLAPRYPGAVIHAADASQNPLIAARLLNPTEREGYISSLMEEYSRLREDYERQTTPLAPLAHARECRYKTKVTGRGLFVPSDVTVEDVPVSELVELVNWRAFLSAWKLPASLANAPGNDGQARQAARLMEDAKRLIASVPAGVVKAVTRFVEARPEDENIIVGDIVIPTPRKLTPSEDGSYPALADFVDPQGEAIGLFGVSVNLPDVDDGYEGLLRQTVAHRLAEAASEWLHRHRARGLGIRPAIGYPVLPDQRLMLTVAKLLPLSRIGITVTENGAMHPSASVSGLYLASPEARYFNVK